MRAHHGGAAPGAGQTSQIKQRDLQFEPHVLVVAAGATVAFPNLDSEEHNVFSPSDPPFNLGRYTTDKVGKAKRFDDPGEIEIYCDIHKQMWARVKVVDTTLYAEVVDGKYDLSGVPPGTYKVVAWMPDSREVKSDVVTIDASGDVQATEIHLHQGAPHGHKRRNGEDYPPY
jgi:plastocyanin